MKIKSTIAAISVATAFVATSAYADGVSTVISIEKANNDVQIIDRTKNVYKSNIQDYVNESVHQTGKPSESVAKAESRWNAEGVL